MPGYSGTPLAKKLGIKEGFRVALVRIPADVKAELRDSLAKCQIVRAGGSSLKDLDFVFLFTKSRAELEAEFLAAAKTLAPAGMIWISWPKKTSGVKSDLAENLIRDMILPTGLVDIKVCAVDETWSGLKFMIRKELR